jgi:hypothetical protein
VCVCVECSEQPRGVRVYCATTGRSVVDVDVIRGSTAGHRQRAHTCQSRRQTFLYSQPNCNLDSTRDKYVRYGEAFPPARSAGAWVQGVAVVRGWPGVGQSSDQHTTCACLCGRMLHLGGQPGEGARWEVAFAQSSCDRETAAASNGGAAAAAPYGSDRRFDEMEYDGVADSSSMGWFGAFAAPLARLEAHVRARQGHKLSHMQSTIEPMKRCRVFHFCLFTCTRTAIRGPPPDKTTTSTHHVHVCTSTTTLNVLRHRRSAKEKSVPAPLRRRRGAARQEATDVLRRIRRRA